MWYLSESPVGPTLRLEADSNCASWLMRTGKEGSRPNKKARAYGKLSLAELQDQCEKYSPLVDISQDKNTAYLRQDVGQQMVEVNTYNVQGPAWAILLSKTWACPQGIYNLEEEEDAYPVKL